MLEIRPILTTLRRHKIVAVLIVLQIALSCAIFCNAVFLIRNRIEHMQRPSGLAEQEIVHVQMPIIGQQDNLSALIREDVAALLALPGVRAASTINVIPFSDGFTTSTVSLVPQQPQPTLKDAAVYLGSERLLETLGADLVAGRHFTLDEYVEWESLGDALGGKAVIPSAVIITRSMANKLFRNQNPLGKSLYVWGNEPSVIVGVIDRLAQVRDDNKIDPSAYGYSMIFPVRVLFNGNYLIRVKDPAQRALVLQAAIDVIGRNNPNRLILAQETLEELRNKYYQHDRDIVWLLVVMCVALLVVTALGIVGLASFWVQQRTRQIGIRRALGATRGQILRYFQTENFLLATFGIVLGMTLAYGLNSLLMHYYELPRLPIIYLPIGAITLWMLGQLAVLGPALRAAAVPPAVATRIV